MCSIYKRERVDLRGHDPNMERLLMSGLAQAGEFRRIQYLVRPKKINVVFPLSLLKKNRVGRLGFQFQFL